MWFIIFDVQIQSMPRIWLFFANKWLCWICIWWYELFDFLPKSDIVLLSTSKIELFWESDIKKKVISEVWKWSHFALSVLWSKYIFWWKWLFSYWNVVVFIVWFESNENCESCKNQKPKVTRKWHESEKENLLDVVHQTKITFILLNFTLFYFIILFCFTCLQYWPWDVLFLVNIVSCYCTCLHSYK